VSKSVLIVEDQAATRRGYASALKKAHWRVREAEDGERAIVALGSEGPFYLLLLDLNLGGGVDDGLAMLDRAQAIGITVPQVFVISGYLDKAGWQKLLDSGIKGLLPKPINPEVLPALLKAFCDENETALINVPGIMDDPALELHIIESQGTRRYLYRRRSQTDSDINHLANVKFIGMEEPLSNAVKRREDALVAEFRKRAARPVPINAPEPLLIVGRRWNSWYPSFYDVEGGCYGILGVKGVDGDTPGTLIDPGFRALRVMDASDIPLGCLRNCIITHNHPDHAAGIFEYVAARHALGQQTSLFCAPPVLEMLKSLAGKNLDVTSFAADDVDIMPPYQAADKKRRRLRATPLPTAHLSVGPHQGTRGVILSSEELVRNAPHILATCVLLGDTEYDSNLYNPNSVFNGIRKALQQPDVKVAVLHIGCSQLKIGTGKHLYLRGLIDILKDIDHWRYTNVPNPTENRLLILISEWGLEHATARQLAGSMRGDLPDDLKAVFGKENLIIKTIRVLNSYRFETLYLLPADVGLSVGLESGNVYLKGVGARKPEEVEVTCDDKGLVYSLHSAARAAATHSP